MRSIGANKWRSCTALPGRVITEGDFRKSGCHFACICATTRHRLIVYA
jgi:hypothetical protein